MACAHQMIEAGKGFGKEIVVQAVRQRIDIERLRIDIDRAFVGFVEREVGAIMVAPDSFFDRRSAPQSSSRRIRFSLRDASCLWSPNFFRE